MAELPSALHITFRPGAAWEALRVADPPARATLLRHALPLSLLPAIAWPLGQAGAPGPGASFLWTLALVLASLVLFAVGFYALAPLFGASRMWRRAFALSAFASTPVLLAGALLVTPVLVIACLGACIHSFALSYEGVQRLLGCPERDAAFFVAAVFMFSLLGSLLAGALCSAAGLV